MNGDLHAGSGYKISTRSRARTAFDGIARLYVPHTTGHLLHAPTATALTTVYPYMDGIRFNRLEQGVKAGVSERPPRTPHAPLADFRKAFDGIYAKKLAYQYP